MKKYMKYIKLIFAIAVIFFMARYFIKNYDSIKELDIHLNIKVFIVSMFFYFAYKLTLASLWHYITVKNDCPIKYTEAVTAYLYSILGKYIPGKVFMLAARFPAYERAGHKLRKITVCFLLENVCTLLGAAFLFIFSLLFFPNDILKNYLWLTIALIIVFFIMINPAIINFFLRLIGRIFKKDDMEITINYKDMLVIVVMFIANWLIVGCGFYFLTTSIYPLPAQNLLYCGGVYGLSAIIGILSLFAPSGIGVREGIMIIGLNIIMPQEYSVIISVVSRIWATVAELVLILAAFIIDRIKKYKERKAVT